MELFIETGSVTTTLTYSTLNGLMKIAYYMPFKPLGHSTPSGDLITGTELFHHLKNGGHDISLASRLRLRWAYYRPALLLQLIREKRQVSSIFGQGQHPDLWLTYHSYYKAPDLLGPSLARTWRIPYIIFQGIYSTKRRRKITTRLGFYLNRHCLLQADHVFTNKKRDLSNLLRLLPKERVSYIAPGIHPQDFSFSDSWRNTMRNNWGSDGKCVILTAAMMRPGVKADGLSQVIRVCGEMSREGIPIQLIVVGDGECRQRLELQTEAESVPALFAGRIPRNQLYQWYSGADIFAFPGIEESLGMVYLEAQSCGLPAVAYGDWGGGEAIIDGKTGLTADYHQPESFGSQIRRLVADQNLRKVLGRQAEQHIRCHHDLSKNYQVLDKKLHNSIRMVRN